MANIYKSLMDVMGDIGAISKDNRNQQQNYMFRGIDAVYNALQPALIKHHVFVVPEVLEQTREERTTSKGGNLIYSILRVKFTFFAEDGSSVSAVVIGEGMDSADKASNKAMSAAFKYACFEVLCIPTEEMVDADQETPQQSGRATRQTRQQKAAPAQQAPQQAAGPGPNDIISETAHNQFVDQVERWAYGFGQTVNWEKLLAPYGVTSTSELTYGMIADIRRKYQL